MEEASIQEQAWAKGPVSAEASAQEQAWAEAPVSEEASAKEQAWAEAQVSAAASIQQSARAGGRELGEASAQQSARAGAPVSDEGLAGQPAWAGAPVSEEASAGQPAWAGAPVSEEASAEQPAWARAPASAAQLPAMTLLHATGQICVEVARPQHRHSKPRSPGHRRQSRVPTSLWPDSFNPPHLVHYIAGFQVNAESLEIHGLRSRPAPTDKLEIVSGTADGQSTRPRN